METSAQKNKCLQCKKYFDKDPRISFPAYKKRKYCSNKCAGIAIRGKLPENWVNLKKDYWKGKKQPKSMVEKRSATLKRIGHRPPHVFGEKTSNWKGGVTNLYDTIRTSKKYIEWRNSVYKRDNYKCTECGDSIGHNLEADHIKPKALIIEENNIKTADQAWQCDELWNISNGRTLCKNCHKKTKTWGSRYFSFRKNLTTINLV